MRKSVPSLLAFLLILLMTSTDGEAGWFKKWKEKNLGGGLSDEKIVLGLKDALKVATGNAVESTGRRDGYFKNEAIKILMPDKLRKVEKTLRKLGMDKKMDEFVESMNRAAEAAAPQAKEIFLDAVKEMTFDDARRILKGKEHEATDFFEKTTRTKLHELFLPVVEGKLEGVGATARFNDIMEDYNKIPFLSASSFELKEYVTGEALDGLFHVLGEEEKKIRTEPAARVTDILKEVFGK